jgi:hypothetical protein
VFINVLLINLSNSVLVLGSLSALTALESEAADRRKEEVRARSRSQQLQLQQQKIQKLTKKRDQLLQKLHNTSAANLGNYRSL